MVKSTSGPNGISYKEKYDYIKGYSKQISKAPAQMDLSKLPKGYAFQIEVKIEDTTNNKSKPVIEGLTLEYN